MASFLPRKPCRANLGPERSLVISPKGKKQQNIPPLRLAWLKSVRVVALPPPNNRGSLDSSVTSVNNRGPRIAHHVLCLFRCHTRLTQPSLAFSVLTCTFTRDGEVAAKKQNRFGLRGANTFYSIGVAQTPPTGQR